MATWQHTDIIIDGQPVKAQAPLIISASRSTDIPAFYADWFFHRLQKGYSAWTNPFNGVKSYVSYKNTRFIVFWSKNPQPLLPYLRILKERNIKCYVQYTLNDYEQEKLEKVPSLVKRIETFKSLVKQLGKGAVIWRFDPMMLTDDISVDDLLWKVQNIGNQLKDYTEKLVFSYADIAMYRKVKHNLEVSGIPYHEWNTKQMEEFADKLSIINRERGWNFQLATCGEKIDISKYGIQHNRCIDGDLITRLAWDDKELMDFIKVKIENVRFLASRSCPMERYSCLIAITSSVNTRKTKDSDHSASAWPLRILVNTALVRIFANTVMPTPPNNWHCKIGSSIKRTDLQKQ